MIYKAFQNLKLSALGMGAMRLPVIGGDDGAVNEGETERMVSYAMDHGINYYDTAWGYHNGQSELDVYKRQGLFQCIPGPRGAGYAAQRIRRDIE